MVVGNTTTVTSDGSAGGPETSTSTDGQDKAPKTLGLVRWVQIAFMAGALLLFWLLERAVMTAWGLWGDPDSGLITAGAAVVAGLVAWRTYRHPRVNQGAFEVVGELVKVTWPSRKETSNSTVVVIITSIIAAVLLGVMDAVWSTLTDFIY